MRPMRPAGTDQTTTDEDPMPRRNNNRRTYRPRPAEENETELTGLGAYELLARRLVAAGIRPPCILDHRPKEQRKETSR